MSANSILNGKIEKELEVEWSTKIPPVPLKIVFCQCGNKIPIYTAKKQLNITCERCGKENVIVKRPDQKIVSNFNIYSILYCAIGIAILLYCGFYTLTAKESPFTRGLAAYFFIGSIIVTIPIVWNIIPQTVEITDYGIRITNLLRTKEARWSEISELKGKRVIIYVDRFTDIGNRDYSSTAPAVVIKTKKWKHTFSESRYGVDELKNIFISMAEYVIPRGARIEDVLGWLPEGLYPREKVHLTRMREYAALSKIGGFMMLVGIILSAMIIFGGIYVVVGMILLFIGGMCVLCGVIGHFDEKKKMTTRKEPKPWIDLAIILAILLVMFAILFYMASLE